jgi:hypothetical protein
MVAIFAMEKNCSEFRWAGNGLNAGFCSIENKKYTWGMIFGLRKIRR